MDNRKEIEKLIRHDLRMVNKRKTSLNSDIECYLNSALVSSKLFCTVPHILNYYYKSLGTTENIAELSSAVCSLHTFIGSYYGKENNKRKRHYSDSEYMQLRKDSNNIFKLFEKMYQKEISCVKSRDKNRI